MASDTKIFERARDELFSHINRCGVLQAVEDDQRQWMDETIDYIGERYPDLSDADLRDLYTVGLRFCKPIIRYGSQTEPAAPVGSSGPPLKVAAAAPVAAPAAPATESDDSEEPAAESPSDETAVAEDATVA